MNNKPLIDPEKIRPPHILLLLVTTGIMIHLILKPEPFIHKPYNWLGIILLIAGIYCNVTASKQFGRSKTPVPHNQTPQTMVTDGVFQYSRNPMYVGGALFLFGLAMMVGSWPFFIVWLLMGAVLNYLYIPWEEKRMEGLFGESYLKYKQQTRRWI